MGRAEPAGQDATRAPEPRKLASPHPKGVELHQQQDHLDRTDRVVRSEEKDSKVRPMTTAQASAIILTGLNLTTEQLRALTRSLARNAKSFDPTAEAVCDVRTIELTEHEKPVQSAMRQIISPRVTRPKHSIDFGNALLSVGDKKIPLTRTEATLLWQLYTHPSGISTEELAKAGGSQPKSIRTYACRLRKKFEGFGSIYSHHECGYILELAGDVQVLRVNSMWKLEPTPKQIDRSRNHQIAALNRNTPSKLVTGRKRLEDDGDAA